MDIKTKGSTLYALTKLLVAVNINVITKKNKSVITNCIGKSLLNI